MKSKTQPIAKRYARQIISLLAITFFIAFSAGCSKNGGDATDPGAEGEGSGMGTFNGKNTPIFLVTWRPNSDGSLSLLFRNEGSEQDTGFRFKGEGPVTEIPIGTYELNKANNGITLFKGEYKRTDFIDAKITISKKGSVYTFNFTFKIGAGEGSGNYKGTLTRLP